MTTPTKITTAMLQQLAEAGIRQRVADIERELAAYHKVWPDVFISPTAPQLLKAPPKPEASNGHWPAVTFTLKPPTPTPPTTKSKHAAAWTPARRAKQARLMKKYRAAGVVTTKASAKRLDKVQAYLTQHGESAIQDLMTAGGYKTSAHIIGMMASGLKSGRFQRTGKGRYALGPKA